MVKLFYTKLLDWQLSIHLYFTCSMEIPVEHGDLLGGGDDCGDCGDAVTTLNDCDGVQQIPDGQ